MKSKKIFKIAHPVLGSIVAVLLSLPGSTSWADAKLSVQEVVDRTNHAVYCPADDMRTDVKMNIVDGQGRERRRELTMLRWDEPPAASVSNKKIHCDKQRYYVYFRRPADVNKTSFLVWKNPSGDDDRWLYLPGLDLVKRISSADKRTSFVGSHAFYEDMSGRAPQLDTHTMHKATGTYYVLDSKPKDPSSVEFSKYRTWIHRKTFLVTKVEFYDAKGKKYREYEAKKVDSVQGHPTVTSARMTDVRSGGYTEVEFRNLKYDIGIPKEVFTERSLRTPPRAHLR